MVRHKDEYGTVFTIDEHVPAADEWTGRAEGRVELDLELVVPGIVCRRHLHEGNGVLDRNECGFGVDERNSSAEQGVAPLHGRKRIREALRVQSTLDLGDGPHRHAPKVIEQPVVALSRIQLPQHRWGHGG